MKQFMLGMFICMCAVSIANGQMLRRMTDNERIGTADLVLVGTVSRIADAGKPEGIVEIEVNKVIKGKEVKKVTVHRLAWIPKDSTVLETGKQYLLFLQDAQEGYIFTRGALSIRPASEAKKIAQLAQDYPVQVELMVIDQAFRTGKETKVNVIVKNVSKQDISISAISLQGFFLESCLERSIDTRVSDPIDSPHTDNTKATKIEAGNVYTTELKFILYYPKIWETPPSEEKRTTGIAVRARVEVDNAIPRKNTADTYFVLSPIQRTIVEYVPIDRYSQNEAGDK